MAQDLDRVGITLSSFPQTPQQNREPPSPAPPLQEPQGSQGQQQHTHGSHSSKDSALVTPDEVLTLGVLALAGLWPGCWSGIAAIIVHKVERLAQSGAADAPFRRCARSLVNLLLQSVGEMSLPAETWEQIADAQARLHGELGKVLGLACSLLQRRSLEVAGTRASKKRRRACSSNAVAALVAPIPLLPAPDATTLLSVVSGFACEEDEEEEKEKKKKQQQQQQQEQLQRQKHKREQEVEDSRKRQRELEGSSVPRLLPPSEVLPLLLQQPQLAPVSAEAAEASAAAEVSAAAAEAAAATPSHPQMPPQSQFSSDGEAAHPVQPPPPQFYSVSPGLGSTEVDFPNLLPPSVSIAPPPSRLANWDINGGHHALQASPLHPAPEVDYPSPHLTAASEPAVAPPTSEAISDVSSSIP